MTGLPLYRVEWRLPAPSGGSAPITRWSGHHDAAAARRAALDALAGGEVVDGEVRIAAGLAGAIPAASVIADAERIERWDPGSEHLPAAKPDGIWTRHRERAGLRAAILLACRTAITRGVTAGLLKKDHAASALTLIALAFDGEDPAAPMELPD